MEKIKHFIQSDTGKDLLILLIIILVGLGSFQLGRLSKGEIKPNIGIDYPDQTAQALKAVPKNESNSKSNTNQTKSVNTSNTINNIPESYEYKGVDLTGRNYFASSRGTKYYSFGCSAGKTIKQENRIYFDTEEQAKKAGYSKSTSCK
jgi:hypothetical protein